MKTEVRVIIMKKSELRREIKSTAGNEFNIEQELKKYFKQEKFLFLINNIILIAQVYLLLCMIWYK
jgi:hypothetical protein